MTDRLQSIRERWAPDSTLPWDLHDAVADARDDIAYLLRCAEAGEALAKEVEHARDGCYKHYSGDNACECPRYNSKLASWRQAREG